MNPQFKTIGLISNGDQGQEPIAIRSFLEYLGYRIIYYEIGRPNDLINVLNRDSLYSDIGTLILSTHGKDGEIVMAELAEEVYEKGEPKRNFGKREVTQFGKLNDFLVVTTGCTLGLLSDSFRATGCKHYIASEEYIEGKSALIFVTTLFYELSKHSNLLEAFNKAQNIDEETRNFSLY